MKTIKINIALLLAAILSMFLMACNIKSNEAGLNDKDAKALEDALNLFGSLSGEEEWPNNAPAPAMDEYVECYGGRQDEEDGRWELSAAVTEGQIDAYIQKLLGSGWRGEPDGSEFTDGEWIMSTHTRESSAEGADYVFELYLTKTSGQWPPELSIFPVYNGDGVTSGYEVMDDIIEGICVFAYFTGETEDGVARYHQALIDAGFEDKYPDYAPSGHFIKIANGKAYCFGNDETWYEPGVANHYWCVYDNPEDAA
ncbi:MAG: hypothetical protein ACLVML_02635 [Candidatus Gastranaerophilaceae bacterium]|nr:hypothetical protein [Christensenellales bacterium]